MTNAINYGKQHITQDDVNTVIETLQSDFLTQGPAIKKFEDSFAQSCDASYACAVTSATAALHIAYLALDFGQNDILWTVPNTFVATSNAALYLGGKVDFIDINLDDFSICLDAMEEKLKQAKSNNTLPKIVTPVHFGGLSCNMKRLKELSDEYGFKIVEDASHCVGASYNRKPVGSCDYSDICVFSFHPVKIITTGEGGMLTTQSKAVYDTLMMARTHGITKNANIMDNKDADPWEMEQHFLGYNYRMTDIQAALGWSQLQRLDDNISRRRQLANQYEQAFQDLPIQVQKQNSDAQSSWHLFPILFKTSKIRHDVYHYLREHKIFAQVHYIPVHTHPYYQKLGFKKGDFPVSEDYYSRCLSIPMYHSLDNNDQNRVIECIREFFRTKDKK